jgi:hypothetical protein
MQVDCATKFTKVLPSFNCICRGSSSAITMDILYTPGESYQLIPPIRVKKNVKELEA